MHGTTKNIVVQPLSVQHKLYCAIGIFGTVTANYSYDMIFENIANCIEFIFTLCLNLSFPLVFGSLTTPLQPSGLHINF